MTKKRGFIGLVVVLEIILFAIGLFLVLQQGTNLTLGIILLSIDVIIFLFIVINYNRLIKYKNKITESFALIDIQLKLRFDLVPNLVNVVKGYAKHEKEVFAQITQLRQQAIESNSEMEKIEKANQMVPQIKHIIAIAEDYPKLKSNTLYKDLMEQLVDIEDRLVAARRIYDSNVNIYNTTLETFPVNVIASIFGFTRQTLFKIDAGENINININIK